MKLSEKLTKLVEKEDALKRLNKRIKAAPISKEKQNVIFILAEVVYGDESSEFAEISYELRNNMKQVDSLMAATDTEYSKDGFVVGDDDDDWDEDESSDYNYYAFYTNAHDAKEVEKVIKKLDNKFGFYAAYINGKQVRL